MGGEGRNEMKLIEADERYIFECCNYDIRVANDDVVIEDKGPKKWWYGKSMLLDVIFCPKCGAKIPTVGVKKPEERFTSDSKKKIVSDPFGPDSVIGLNEKIMPQLKSREKKIYKEGN